MYYIILEQIILITLNENECLVVLCTSLGEMEKWNWIFFFLEKTKEGNQLGWGQGVKIYI